MAGFSTAARLVPCAVLVALGTLLGGGCAHDCRASQVDAVEYTEGTVNPSGTVYVTSDWNEGWLHFPAGRRYKLVHGLGQTPHTVNTYLSFSESPLSSGNNASESAGNQAVIEGVTDEAVTIRNDSCAEFWLRLTADAS